MTSPWTVLGESLNGYIRTEILTAACELGLFTHLEQAGSATARQVAERCGISEHGARILLLGCCEAGLTERNADGSCRNAPAASTYLVDGARYCMLGFVRFTREVQQKTCNLLLDSIRAGRPVGLRALGYEDTKTLYQAFAEELPGGFDAVLLSHFVEIFAPERIQEIYGKVQRALVPGGRVLLWTMTADDAETGPLQAVKSSVYFVASASGSGMAYPASDHRRWLDEAGFDVATERPYPEICQTLFIARKR